MSKPRKPLPCVQIEPELIAVATGEATGAAAERVQAHVGTCRTCRDDFTRYRAVDAVVGTLRGEAPPTADAEAARARLTARLADLKSRMVSYKVFPSPLGPILIAASEHGVALVEYLRGGAADSRLFRMEAVETQEGGGALDRLHGELLDYLAGRRTRLEWPLDLRFARSEFERAVLQATAAVPYGAVSSYTGIAGDVGKPSAVRAVAQALRHNPVPIVVPCHRIVGISGDLVGYAGDRLALKERLLAVEGVPTVHARSRIAREVMYHYDTNPLRQYCVPSCGTILTRPLGQVKLFASREFAEAVGLSPCDDCRPDLHPLAH
jgi:methylated-DNA-[protein]-cysteine S-methyltransferase